MTQNLREKMSQLRRIIRPIQILIGLELAAALGLMFWLGYRSGRGLDGWLLMAMVLTFLQPKTQFGLVWSWKDRIRDLETTPAGQEDMEILEHLRKEGMEQLQTYVMASPVFLLLELGVYGTAGYLAPVVFGGVCYLIFELWQQRYRLCLELPAVGV